MNRQFPKPDELTDAANSPDPLKRRIERAVAHVNVLRHHVQASINVAQAFGGDPTSDEYQQSVGIIESLESNLLDKRIALALLKIELYSGSREGVAQSLENMVGSHEQRIAAESQPAPTPDPSLAPSRDGGNPTPEVPPGVSVPDAPPAPEGTAQELPSPLKNVEPESGTPGLVESDETDGKES